LVPLVGEAGGAITAGPQLPPPPGQLRNQWQNIVGAAGLSLQGQELGSAARTDAGKKRKRSPGALMAGLWDNGRALARVWTSKFSFLLLLRVCGMTANKHLMISTARARTRAVAVLVCTSPAESLCHVSDSVQCAATPSRAGSVLLMTDIRNSQSCHCVGPCLLSSL